LSKAVHGNNKAFEELMSPYMKIIYNYILVHVTNTEDVKDILQDTMLGVWCSLKTFNWQSSFKTWIIGITRRKIADYYRKIYSDKKKDQLDISQLNEDFQLVSQWRDFTDSTLYKIDIRNAINNLSPRDKDLLYLVFNVQLTYNEIQDITKIPVGTIKSRIYAIKAKLRPLLEDRRDNCE